MSARRAQPCATASVMGGVPSGAGGGSFGLTGFASASTNSASTNSASIGSSTVTFFPFTMFPLLSTQAPRHYPPKSQFHQDEIAPADDSERTGRVAPKSER